MSTRSGSRQRPPAIAVVTCAVLEKEIAHFTAGLEHIVHIEVIEQGLHNEPDRLRTTIQAAVSRIEAMAPPPPARRAEAIVLGYGLCSRGLEGVRTQRCRLVVTRAHDCVTLLLGDKDRYADYVKQHPGTYWYSPGWIHHTPMPGKDRYDRLLEQYRRDYGEDNARYLMESEQHWFSTYDRATFVDLTVDRSDEHEAYTRQCADWLGWTFDRQQGDPDLLRSLLAGRWDEGRFVVLEPGQTICLTADERIIEACEADPLPAEHTTDG